MTETIPSNRVLPSRRRLRRLGRKLSELWQARELLRNLVVRDLKVRYKNSALGFAWSMLTPLSMMLIFTFVFTVVFRLPIQDFQIFFLAGFLPWLYFSNSLSGSVGAIVGNGPLIKKVYFPREVLPLATVLSQGVHFILSISVFGIYAAIEGYNFLPYIPFLILGFILLTAFNSGLTMAFAGANVSFRDLQELMGVILLLWFYATPIFYQMSNVPAKFRLFMRLNPLTWFMEYFRDTLYYLQVPSGRVILVCSGAAAVMLSVGYALFSKLAVTFAKEI